MHSYQTPMNSSNTLECTIRTNSSFNSRMHCKKPSTPIHSYFSAVSGFSSLFFSSFYFTSSLPYHVLYSILFYFLISLLSSLSLYWSLDFFPLSFPFLVLIHKIKKTLREDFLGRGGDQATKSSRWCEFQIMNWREYRWTKKKQKDITCEDPEKKEQEQKYVNGWWSSVRLKMLQRCTGSNRDYSLERKWKGGHRSADIQYHGWVLFSMGWILSWDFKEECDVTKFASVCGIDCRSTRFRQIMLLNQFNQVVLMLHECEQDCTVVIQANSAYLLDFNVYSSAHKVQEEGWLPMSYNPS
jgi:hypothetical protein